MRAKDYLNQIRLLDVMIGQRIEELEEMRARISVVTGIDYSKDRVQSTPESGNKQIENLVDFEKGLLDLIYKETTVKHRIIGEIQELNNPVYVDLLFRRYVECHSFEKIAYDMSYAYNYVCTLHGEALKEFGKVVLGESELSS